MTRPLSNDLRERVVAAMRGGKSCRSVAARFGVAPSSVVKWTQRAIRTGSVDPGKMGGRRMPVLEAYRDWVLEQIRARPEIGTKALQGPLAERGAELFDSAHDSVDDWYSHGAGPRDGWQQDADGVIHTPQAVGEHALVGLVAGL